jgi:hypothetical protein
MTASALKVLGQIDRLSLVAAALVLFVADCVAGTSTEDATDEGTFCGVAGLVTDDTTDDSSTKGASSGLVLSVGVVVGAVGEAEGRCCKEDGFKDSFHRFGIWLVSMTG